MLHNHNQDRYRILIIDHQFGVRISNRTNNRTNNRTKDRFNALTNNRTNSQIKGPSNARTNILIRDHNMVAVGQGVITTIKISEIKPMETKLKTNLFQPFT